ncbi:MAG: hypothetical protein U0T83_06335 [Bacteriovoracaceae bacterium]
MISIREDEIASESMGVNTAYYKVIAFVVGCGFAGLAGSLFAHAQQFLHPNGFNFTWSVIILLMIILGAPWFHFRLNFRCYYFDGASRGLAPLW